MERFDIYARAFDDAVPTPDRSDTASPECEGTVTAGGIETVCVDCGQVVKRAQQVDNPVLVLESLRHIRENVDYGAFINRRLHGWAFAKLHTHIQFKAEETGIPVATVNPRNTSKECHACGETGTRPQQATFRCTNDECRVGEYQADVNAALNIADRYRSGESRSQTDQDSGQKPVGDDLATDGASLFRPQDSRSEGEPRPATSGTYAS